MKKFRGIYPALITPFDQSGRINLNMLERLIEVNIKKGVSGFYVGGSTGESYLLSTEERKQIIKHVVQYVNGRADVIANIGVFATEHGIELAKYAENVGVDAVSSVPPFYFKFSGEEYFLYYKEIADAVSVPMIIYNIPAMSGINFANSEIERFFSQDKIAGMKHTSYDLLQMQRMIEKYPEKSVFIGHDELFLPAYTVGAEAAIGSTFNFMAEKFIRIGQLVQENRMDEALHIQNQANTIIEVLLEMGVFKGVKAALQLQGYDCGDCRKPFLPLENSEKKRLQKVLQDNGCL